MKGFLIIIAIAGFAFLASVACLGNKPVTFELDGHEYNCEALFTILSVHGSWGFVVRDLQRHYELSEQEASDVHVGCRRAIWNEVRPLPK